MRERIIVVDVNARGKGIRYSTLDVVGVGPRAVTGFLRSLGLNAELYPFEEVMRDPNILNEFDVLALSAMITDAEAVEKVCREWRRRRKGPVVLGGPLTLSQSAIESLDFDLAIVGECEIPLKTIIHRFGSLTDAVHALKLGKESVDGVAVKGLGNAPSLAPWASREVIESYLPDVDGVKRYDFWWACRVYVEVVRGCSNFRRPQFTTRGAKCIGCELCISGPLSDRLRCPVGIPPGCGYCSVPLIHGPPRSRSVDSIVREVKLLLDTGVTRIVLSAPDFLDYGRDLLVHPQPLTDPRDPPPNIDYIEKLLRSLVSLDRVSEGLATIMIENVKPCLVNEYVAEVLGRYLRGTPVYIGVESGSNPLLERVGRPCTVEECIKAIKLLARAGLRPYVYLMHGLPSESEEDLLRSAKLVRELMELGVEKIVLYRFTPLPRTAFENAPRPPPAIKRRGARELYYEVRKFNKLAKERLLGKKVKLVVASTHPKRRGCLIAYPLSHGPTTIIRGSPRLVGTIVEAVIERVVSDRLVEGRVISVIKRVVEV